jgi:hypothetical protein
MGSRSSSGSSFGAPAIMGGNRSFTPPSASSRGSYGGSFGVSQRGGSGGGFGRIR